MTQRITAAELIAESRASRRSDAAPRGNPEAAIQKRIVAHLRAALPAPGMVHASGHEQRGHGQDAKRRQGILKDMGTLAGFPDLIVLAPGADGSGRVLFIEVKAPKGSLQPSQRAFRDAAQAMGFAWAVARSEDEALAAVEAAGIITRPRHG